MKMEARSRTCTIEGEIFDMGEEGSKETVTGVCARKAQRMSVLICGRGWGGRGKSERRDPITGAAYNGCGVINADFGK